MVNSKQKDQNIADLLNIERSDRLSTIIIDNLAKKPVLLAHYLASSKEHTFSELLFRLTNEKYSEKKAIILWAGILKHQRKVNKKFGRDAGILVASLDYLTNITNEISDPKITHDHGIETAARMATTDPLTGLYSKKVFAISLEKEIYRSVRYRKALSLLMMDIDDFKRFNDTFGHQEGDRLLVKLVRIIAKTLRTADFFARYGGEEFAVIMPETAPGEAFAVSERLRTNVARHLKASGHEVTISIGIGTLTRTINTSYALIKRADDALYKAKKAGKNRVKLC
jgi:diguanylate cyclase (GGDEF)-like protein